MSEQILLMSGINNGGSNKMSCKIKFDERSGTYVKRCSKKRKKSGFFGSLGAGGGFFEGVTIKQIVYTGGLGAAGAIMTNKAWEYLSKYLVTGEGIAQKPIFEAGGMVESFAKMSVGALMALLVAKLAKKPNLGIALATGPIVAGLTTLVGDVLSETTGTTGIGRTGSVVSVSLPGPQYASNKLPFDMSGIPGIGDSVPQWMNYPSN